MPADKLNINKAPDPVGTYLRVYTSDAKLLEKRKGSNGAKVVTGIATVAV